MMDRLGRGLLLHPGSVTPRWALQAVFCACVVCMVMLTSCVGARSPAAQDGSASGTARWRAGEAIVSESAADADGWLTLTCEGSGCAALLDKITTSLPQEEQKLVAGSLQVRAEPWHHKQLIHYGPFRVMNETSNFEHRADVKAIDDALSVPWLDARSAAYACRWHDNAGAHHLLELAGGPTAVYTGPDGQARRLVLESFHICSMCRGMPNLDLRWRDPLQADAKSDVLRLVVETRKDSGADHTSGGWMKQHGASMECTLR